MLIRFGFHLDGLHPLPPHTSVGVVTLGPLGLLDVLETRLGLPPVFATPADSLMTYRACLLEAAQVGRGVGSRLPPRFYQASFELDPVNVTRTLLRWRAELYEHGWNGTFVAEVSPRLQDLAAVEAIAAARVPLTRGQRVQRAIAALNERSARIDRVELQGEPAELPAVWRTLLETLRYESAIDAPTSQAAIGTDLRAVQDTLAELAASPDGQRRAKIPLRRDGTFAAIRGSSRDITAQAVAEHVFAAPSADDVLVIAERDGIILDNALERTGLPRVGFTHHSRFRAVTQVLKLALALLWQPVSPHLLLQFLIHPVGPLRRYVRDQLAAAVAEQPGIGGRAWIAALARIEKWQQETTAKDVDELRQTIATWVAGERFDPAHGAPIAALALRTQLCARYLAARLNTTLDDERVLFATALTQTADLGKALVSLADQGQERVTRIELDRLIDEVSVAAPDPNIFAQVRHVRAAVNPAAVTSTFRRVYWWDLTTPTQEIGYPWSHKELAALRASGVALPTVVDVLRFRTRQWLRPILAASERLTLVVHDSEQGYHPLWTQVTNLFENIAEARIDSELLNGLPCGTETSVVGMPTRALPERRLPAPRRWWQLPDESVVPRRDVESYSSLAKLFDFPHGYVLRYAAQLRPGRAQELVDGNRLYGNLAHTLFERFFTDNTIWQMLDAATIRRWFAAALPPLIEAEGAVLLEPGRGVDKQRVVTTLDRALHSLLDHLRAAGIETVRPEFYAEGKFKSVGLRGEIDLLLTDAHGREIVLDVKWGSELYHAKELAANRHLQLATYAYLRRAGKRIPYQAFFIIETGHVLAVDSSVFPDAVTHPNAAGVAELWERMATSYDWRRQQLDGGAIEVNVAASQPTDASIPPLRALEMVTEPDNFDDFVHLTGWDDYQ